MAHHLVTRTLIVTLWFSSFFATTFAHSYGAHGLQGGDPPNEPSLPAITGAFEAKVSARFDNLAGIGFAGWQTIYETTVAIAQDTIYVGQRDFSNDIQVGVYAGVVSYAVILPNTITAGVEGTWYFGVQADGVLWVEDESGANRVETQAAVPPNVVRTQSLIGGGLWNPPLDPLQGVVTGIEIRNLIDPPSSVLSELFNLPGQMWGPFTVSFYARFDHVNTASKVFCVTNDDASSTISFGRHDILTTTAVFEIETTGGGSQLILAVNSIVVDEMAFWHVTVDAVGQVSITKNGSLVGFIPSNASMIPDVIFRRNQYIGQGCSQVAAEKLDGVVMGLRVDLDGTS